MAPSQVLQFRALRSCADSQPPLSQSNHPDVPAMKESANPCLHSPTDKRRRWPRRNSSPTPQPMKDQHPNQTEQSHLQLWHERISAAMSGTRPPPAIASAPYPEAESHFRPEDQPVLNRPRKS